MKAFKNMLHLWISITSVFGFFGAWSMLAQSFRPTQSQPLTIPVYPTPAPLPPIGVNAVSQADINLQIATMAPAPIPMPMPQQHSQPVFRRLLRTGAS
jgi:hypothetical protein